MDRPASRGLMEGGVQKAPTGLAVDRPERPSGAASRQQQPVRLGTSSRGGGAGAAGGLLGPPPSTAFRRVLPGSGNQQAQAAAAQAQARPLTQQGIGLEPATAGGSSGRQVLDRTYFINELCQKWQQVFNITGQMRDELEVLEQKKAAAARAEKLAGQLKKEVRLLQEALADNNIVIDKVGSQTPLQQIHGEYADIKARNDGQQGRVEDILSQRLAAEAHTKQVEAQIAAIQATIDRRLSSMPPAAHQAYAELQAEQAVLLAEATRFEEEGAELAAALAAAEGELSRNSLKQRALNVQEQVRLLTQRKVELAAAEEATKASAEEQRETLMARVKRDNAAVEQLTAEAKQLQGRVKQLEAQHQAAAAAGPGSAAGADVQQDDPERRAKFEELRTKERELTGFIDTFPQRRSAKQAELSAKQDNILRLLEHLACLQQGGGQAASPAAPGAAGSSPPAQQSRVSLGAAAAATLAGGSPGGHGAGAAAASSSELAGKRAELAKLEGLQAKIEEELAALRERVDGMAAEVERFSDVEGARGAKEAERQQLEGRQRELQQQSDALQAELADAKWALQTHEAQLREQPAWPAIDRLEQQLRQVAAQADKSRAATQAHAEQSAYEPLLPQVAALVEAINAANIEAALSAPAV